MTRYERLIETLKDCAAEIDNLIEVAGEAPLGAGAAGAIERKTWAPKMRQRIEFARETAAQARAMIAEVE